MPTNHHSWIPTSSFPSPHLQRPSPDLPPQPIHRPHLATPHPPPAMPALAHTSRAIARSWTAHQLPVARASCAAMQTRNASDASASFDSPFKGASKSTKIPSFGAYRSKSGEEGAKVFSYFMAGTMGALSAMGAKATVQGTTPLQTTAGATDGIWTGRGTFNKRLGDQLACVQMDWGHAVMAIVRLLILCLCRLPRQHVRLRRRFGSGQG